MYFRSFTPISLDQKPVDVKSRKRLKKETPSDMLAGARAGHAMSLRIASRCACEASANGLPNLEFDCASIHASPSLIHFWLFGRSVMVKSINSGTPASVALPERSSRG